MKTEREVEEFRLRLLSKYDEDDPRVEYRVSCFESGIPKSFWSVSADKVTYNLDVFDNTVRKYCKRWKKARKNGYSLAFTGDNGSGKTMFINYILTQMLKRGCSVYYTTLAQLDVDIKRGFRDEVAEARLNELMSCDFLGLDEVGKEHFKGDSYLMTRLELYLKSRYDDDEPVLMASNLDYEKICEMYGPTISSMLEGKYRVVQMESGDFRKSVATKMKVDMGFEG